MPVSPCSRFRLFLLVAVCLAAWGMAAPCAGEPPSSGLYLVIDKSSHVLFVMRGDKKIKQYGIAVGKNKGDKQRAGDMRTPEGTFAVQQIQNASAWTHDFKDGKGAIAGAYGPFFIRLRTPPWTGIGIHGTHAPESIGTDATEGCVRLHNRALAELVKIVTVGMPVVIQ